MADKADDSLYPIAVLIDELKNEDIQVSDAMLDGPVHHFISQFVCILASFEFH